jgi:hypothetical protein
MIYVEAGDGKVVLACFEEATRLPQARCGRRGGFPPLHDSFAEAAARRGRLGRDRPRTAALARPGARKAIVLERERKGPASDFRQR